MGGGWRFWGFDCCFLMVCWLWLLLGVVVVVVVCLVFFRVFCVSVLLVGFAPDFFVCCLCYCSPSGVFGFDCVLNFGFQWLSVFLFLFLGF